MSDTPAFESPIVASYPPAGDASLQLVDVSSTTKTIVRADADTNAAQQAGVAFGSSRHEGDVLVCGQRPSEWMVLGTAEANEAFIASLDQTGHVSVIDHTHSRALFRLTGAASTSALEKVCGIDWSDQMTPDGAVLSASVAKVTCDITRDDQGGERSYLLACDRSFGQYVFDALIDAGEEFGIGVG